MKKYLIRLVSVVLIPLTAVSQEMAEEPPPPETPKLVVGIVVDQMRYEHLFRYWDVYGDEGFKRLLTIGLQLSECPLQLHAHLYRTGTC